MWKIVAWGTFIIAIGWGGITGIWSVGLTQQVLDSWIGEPESLIIPYLDTHVLAAPAAPLYAIITQGDWLPLLSIVICTSGSFSLWRLSKKARAKAYPNENKSEEKK